MATNTLQEWFETPLGQYLLDKERAYLDDVTPDIFGFHALQLGLPRFDLLRESRIAHRLRVACTDHPDLYAKSHELPLATQSIDLVLLPHALELLKGDAGEQREGERRGTKDLPPEPHGDGESKRRAKARGQRCRSVTRRVPRGPRRKASTGPRGGDAEGQPARTAGAPQPLRIKHRALPSRTGSGAC